MNNNKTNSKTASKIKKLATFWKNLLLEEKILLLNLIIIINLLDIYIPILMIILN